MIDLSNAPSIDNCGRIINSSEREMNMNTVVNHKVNVQAVANVETMSSSELAELLGYDKKEINKKIRNMFAEKIVMGIISSTVRANGNVDEYHLPKLESAMFISKWNISLIETDFEVIWNNRSSNQCNRDTQTNNVQIFSFGNLDIRVVVGEDNEPMFMGKDVAEALGYARPSDAIAAHVDDEDKLIRQFAVSGQNRNMIMINESGMYSLIFGSKLDSAKQFKNWVTRDVLPTLRKTGTYSMNVQSTDPMTLMLQAMVDTRVKQEAISNQVGLLEERIGKLEDKTTVVNQTEVGYVTLGEAVVSVFPEISKDALKKFVSAYQLKYLPYEYYVESVGKVTVSKQYKITDIQKLRKIVLEESTPIGNGFFYTHENFRGRFILNK